VSYSTTADTLTVLVESHSNHAANQEVDVFIDVDLDGSADRLMSTYNADTGGFDGGLYWWDDVGGVWEMYAVPDPFQYTSGWDFVMFGADLADLGNPMVAYTYAYAHNPAYTATDEAPDVIQYFSDYGVLALSDTPFFIFDSAGVWEVIGNGDGSIDPAETWAVEILMTNAGVADSTVTSGTVVSNDGEIILTSDFADFGMMLSGDTAAGNPEYEFVVAPWAAPGTYTLILEMDGDGYTQEISLSLTI